MVKFTVNKRNKGSRYIGVYFNKNTNSYFTIINYKGKKKKYGPFKSEIKAAREYDKQNIKLKCFNKLFNFQKLNNKKRKRDNNMNNKKRKRDNNVKSTNLKKKRKFKRYKRRSIRRGELWPTLIKQHFKCNICKKLLNCPPIMDHIKPLKLGGNYKMNNLQAICSTCNSWKSGMYDYQLEKMLMYNDMKQEDILDNLQKVYANKFGNNIKTQFNFINTSTINLTVNN